MELQQNTLAAKSRCPPLFLKRQEIPKRRNQSKLKYDKHHFLTGNPGQRHPGITSESHCIISIYLDKTMLRRSHAGSGMHHYSCNPTSNTSSFPTHPLIFPGMPQSNPTGPGNKPCHIPSHPMYPAIFPPK